ncbi:MAG TPA: FtsX-like permease family protein, partial [Actinotalea sp.]
MLRLTLAQMRRSLGRLVAAGVAITIGTAFVAATLLAAEAMTRTTYAAVTTGFAHADLVVTDGEVTDATLALIGSTSGVRAVQGYAELGLDLRGPEGQTFLPARAAAAASTLEPAKLAAGTLPSGPSEIVLPAATATLLGVAVGDPVTVVLTGWRTDDGSTVERVDHPRLSGTLDQPPAAFLSTGGVAVVTQPLLDEWFAFVDPSFPRPTYSYATVAVDDAGEVAAVQERLVGALDQAGSGVAVRTLDEQARRTTAELTGDGEQLTAVVLGFAAVALIVAALVITNTFQVIVAQRTRTLALLRCVGADRAQLRRSVILEALILGVASSVAGLVLGVAVVQVALLVLNGRVTDVPIPAVVAMTPASILAPLLIGTVVTLLAGLSPARAATRVSPLAALRPSDAPTVDQRSGRLRAVLAALLVVGGTAALVGGSVLAASHETLVGLGIAVLGGAMSFVGVVLGSVFWVPRLISRVGRLLGSRPTARLAAVNSVRNPRRTAATSAALFIGVTLVALMATGAASARTALDQTLSARFSVDVSVSGIDGGEGAPALPAGLKAQISAIDGVGAVAELTATSVDISRSGGESLGQVETVAIEPARATTVVRTPEQVAGLAAGTAIIPRDLVRWSGITDGEQLTLRRWAPAVVDGQDSSTGPDRPAITVTAVLSDLPGNAVVLTPSTFDEIAPGIPASRLWVKLAAPDDAERVVAEISSAASETGVSLETVGSAVERAFYQRVVNTLLAVVVGLLGVAVVIALVGVTNTLSLSVLERRRESATLRALGLTRRQLRGTLAIEGMLIAGVGSVVGVILGTLYGWMGARTLLGNLADVGLTVPWRDLGLVLVVGLLAGLLASVLPGRS